MNGCGKWVECTYPAADRSYSSFMVRCGHVGPDNEIVQCIRCVDELPIPRPPQKAPERIARGDE